MSSIKKAKLLSNIYKKYNNLHQKFSYLYLMKRIFDKLLINKRDVKRTITERRQQYGGIFTAIYT